MRVWLANIELAEKNERKATASRANDVKPVSPSGPKKVLEWHGNCIPGGERMSTVEPTPLLWKCHTPKLLEEAALNAAILNVPFQILLRLLGQVTERAALLDDPQLNALMIRLTLYSCADPALKEYDPKRCAEVIKKAAALAASKVKESMSLLERNPKYMSLMEQIVSHVANDIHYGGGPRMQEIANELAEKYPLVNAAPQLRDAAKKLVAQFEKFARYQDQRLGHGLKEACQNWKETSEIDERMFDFGPLIAALAAAGVKE